MNTQKKGDRLELEYKKFKESQGYVCFKPSRVEKYGQKDMFGLFDVMGTNGVDFFLAQVKANYCSPTVKGLIDKFKVPSPIRKLVVVRKDFDSEWIEEEVI